MIGKEGLTDTFFMWPIGETSILETTSSFIRVVIDCLEDSPAGFPLGFEGYIAFAEETL